MHIIEAALVSNLAHLPVRTCRRAEAEPADAGPQTSIALQTGRTSMVAARAIGWVLASATASFMLSHRTSS